MTNVVRIDADFTWRGFRAIVMENHALRAMFLPELGGKLWSLVDKRTDREVLWHNPRVGPRPAMYGAAYDDWFCGGWDELFPNDAPTTHAGELYPDHGEWWALPFSWQVAQHDSSVTLTLTRNGVVTNTSVTKSVTLRANATILEFDYTLTNHSYKGLDYLWKLHPAMAITPASRIDLPAQHVVVDAGFRDRLGNDVAQLQWPHAQTPHGMVDMRRVPAIESRSCDFYYAIDITRGWCALTDTSTQSGAGTRV